MTVFKCEARYAGISWEPPSTNFQWPVQMYHIEFSVSRYTPEWHEGVLVDGKITKSIVPLPANTVNSFRVIAYYDFGASPPAKTDVKCMTKPAPPDRNPTDVTGAGTSTDNMIITWTVS